MDLEATKADLLALTARAARRLKPSPVTREQPAPGDLYVSWRTAHLPIRWAVLEVDSAESAGVLVAPVDCAPWAAADDFPIGEGAGADIIRLAATLRVPASRLKPHLLVGAMTADEVEGARSKLRGAIHADGPSTKPDSSLESEHRDWLAEVVRPARALLAGSEAPSKIDPCSTGSRPAQGRRGLKAAALAGVALAAAMLWVTQRLELPGRDPMPTADVPLALLLPFEATRGDERQVLAVDGTLDRFLVVLELDPLALHSAYSLEIRSLPNGISLWSSGRIQRSGRLRLALELPTTLFPPGTYEITLRSWGHAAPAVDRYFLDVDRR